MAELSSCPDRDPGNFSVLEIRKAVKLLKSKKACGNDNIYNEHILHGVMNYSAKSHCFIPICLLADTYLIHLNRV